MIRVPNGTLLERMLTDTRRSELERNAGSELHHYVPLSCEYRIHANWPDQLGIPNSGPMKHLYAYVLLFVAPTTSLLAQPTLGSGSATPTPGEQITYANGDYALPGAAGANLTWDHSSITNNASNIQNWVTPASTGLSAAYPNATVALDATGSDYLFYTGSATGFEQDGFSVGGFTGTCSDRLTMLAYPSSYSSTFADNMQCSITDGNTTWARTATITGEADGYGTVILPWGTVNNVLRVHTVQHMIDNQYTPASEYDYDSYSWYKPGTHGPVLNIDKTSVNFFGILINDSSATVIDAASVGLAEALRHDIGVDVYPNPATDRVEVVYGVAGGQVMTMDVLDLTGKVVLTIGRRTQVAGVQREVLDLSDLSAGAYLVRVTDANGATGMKRVVKR